MEYFKNLFIYLASPDLSCSTQDLQSSLGHKTLCCSMWDPVPQLGTEHRPPALGAQSLSYWTTREVPEFWCLEISLFGLQSFFLRQSQGRVGEEFSYSQC